MKYSHTTGTRRYYPDQSEVLWGLSEVPGLPVPTGGLQCRHPQHWGTTKSSTKIHKSYF